MKRVRVVQLSDCHLYGNPEGTLMGVDTRSSFQAVMDDISQRITNPDVFIVTGDLTHDDSKASYEWLKQALDTTAIPYYWIAGNHDVPELMHQVNAAAMTRAVEQGHWQLILMNSHQDGKVMGYLPPSELSFLKQRLEQHPDLYTLIAIHHPAFTINSRWLDNINLHNSQAFWDLVEQYPNVRVVLNGHIHQQKDSEKGPVQILSTPSTAVQFKPETETFCLDPIPPGYRVIDLLPDGDIETQVVRVSHFEAAVDLTSSGY